METLIIQSNISNLQEVEKFISTICEEYHVRNYYATISTAILQAVENAIVHGNKNDESKVVSIKFGYCRGGIGFTIQDQGSGFDFGKYGHLPAQGECGEGIFMMKSLSDSIFFLDGGRTVRMEFLIQGIRREDSLERASLMKKFYAMEKVHA